MLGSHKKVYFFTDRVGKGGEGGGLKREAIKELFFLMRCPGKNILFSEHFATIFVDLSIICIIHKKSKKVKYAQLLFIIVIYARFTILENK